MFLSQILVNKMLFVSPKESGKHTLGTQNILMEMNSRLASPLFPANLHRPPEDSVLIWSPVMTKSPGFFLPGYPRSSCSCSPEARINSLLWFAHSPLSLTQVSGHCFDLVLEFGPVAPNIVLLENNRCISCLPINKQHIKISGNC